ncbi:response regulator [Desertivirga xinjiangensis]|uniref:response regulator n=1 Tax=Desertivirga xinjiangensis TaxID=539206 RepID=UPI00210E3B28|nr:response regulator [Pedobacter xinjiangensis]
MSKRVLIFDDDIDILSICTYILEEQGWEVQTSSHCNNIIETVRGFMPNVILMDNWIPDTGGVIATQTIKKDETLKDIPVIYFSANNDIQTLARQAGADTYLEKPFDLNELEAVIEGVANGKARAV